MNSQSCIPWPLSIPIQLGRYHQDRVTKLLRPAVVVAAADCSALEVVQILAKPTVYPDLLVSIAMEY